MTNLIGALEIVGIRESGNLDKERLLLRAIYPVKPEFYIIINVKQVSTGQITILNDKVFWFPIGYQINAGEYIRLYTKKGTNFKENSTYGDQPAVYHNFYWGLTAPVWDGVHSDAVTIFKIESWNTIAK